MPAPSPPLLQTTRSAPAIYLIAAALRALAEGFPGAAVEHLETAAELLRQQRPAQ